MGILRIRAHPFILRVGFNRHLDILKALTSDPPLPVDVIVVEAPWAQRHHRLVEKAKQGHQLVIDPRIDQWTIPGSSALPAGRFGAFDAQEISAHAADLAASFLEIQEGCAWIVAPACHVEVVDSPEWLATLRLFDETTEQLGRRPVARLIGTPAALGSGDAVKHILEDFGARGVGDVMLTTGPIDNDDDGARVLHLIRSLESHGVGVHLTHAGPLGFAAMAVGASSFDSGLLGEGERFDFAAQRSRAAGARGFRRPKPRSYSATLLASVPRDALGKMLRLRSIQGALHCPWPCCLTIDGAVINPEAHFLHSLMAQVRNIEHQVPDARLAQVTMMFRQSRELADDLRAAVVHNPGVLEAAELKAVSNRLASVRSAARQLHRVIDEAQWNVL